MNKYFSTFISGTQKIVESELSKLIKDIKIESLSDGIIVFNTMQSLEFIKQIRFLNNSFILLLQKNLKTNYSPTNVVREIVDKKINLQFPNRELLQKFRSVRVIASIENQIVKIESKRLKQIEEYFTQRTKLKIDRANPDTELWITIRSDGLCLVGLRITKKPDYKKVLHKGELRPELVNLMITLADLNNLDVVIDPFAGYGSIPLEIEKHFLVNQVVAIEKDKVVFNLLKERLIEHRSKITFKNVDSLNLRDVKADSIDKIITDPPWGIFNSDLDANTFYRQMFKEFTRIIKKDGNIVILTAQKEILLDILNNSTELFLLENYNILVSGKKSGLFKIKKI